MGKIKFLLGALLRRLWVRASLFAAGAVVAALAAHELGRFVPSDWVGFLGDAAVEEILQTLASAMLPVVTFSMATVVAAHGAVMSNASPRAASLVIEDQSAHNALASFIGAFIFSVVGLAALGTNYYSPEARLVLFLMTLAVLAWVILRLLGWVDELSRMVRVRKAIQRVEEETRKALNGRSAFLGGVPDGELPPGAVPLLPERVGYLQHVDVERLDRLAEKYGVRVQISSLPGAFVRKHRPLMHVLGASPKLSDEALRKLSSTVVIADRRDFRQDPRNGLVVLGEIASRALSPGINDPGTAIDVIGTATRVLSVWGAEHWAKTPCRRFERVLVPPLSARDCFEDVFRPVSRDGASVVEVGIALQQALEDLSLSDAAGFREAAIETSRAALTRAEAQLTLDADLEELREYARWSLRVG